MPDQFKVRKLNTAANTKATRKGLLVFVMAYSKRAIDNGKRNQKPIGAKAPDNANPLTIAINRLTIRVQQSFDLYLRLIHTVFAAHKLMINPQVFWAILNQHKEA